MKRRRFFHRIVLGSASLAGLAGMDFRVAKRPSRSAPAKSRYRWVVLYWMPYDNDLARFGEPIVEMLTRGTRNPETTVIVQSDYWGDTKMRRRQLLNGQIREFEVSGEDSSDVSAFSAYLDWAYQTLEAERWAVIVVGHGGKINEISPDDHGKDWQTRTWMGVDQFAQVVSRLNQATRGRVELLFFQNCNKATLEVVYEARNCARYTLASQQTLGAPNYYYEGFLDRLREPSVGGREAAIAIMDSERAEMYHTLTLVDNQAVKRIPEKLSQVLQPILGNQLSVLTQLAHSTYNYPELSTYSYFDEEHCDLLNLLSYLSRGISRLGQDELTKFANFLRSSVIVHYKTGGELYGLRPLEQVNAEKLCGLGLYLPEKEQEIVRYSYLGLYRKVDLVSLYKGMFIN